MVNEIFFNVHEFVYGVCVYVDNRDTIENYIL